MLFSAFNPSKYLSLKATMFKATMIKPTMLAVCLCQIGLLMGCSAESSPETNPDKATDASQQRPQNDVLRIAAAANLSSVLPAIIEAYNHSADNSDGEDKAYPDRKDIDRKTLRIEVTYASSGKLYAQIKAGASYDVFLSANQSFPAKLGLASSQPFTYTQGQLAWYSTLHPIESIASITAAHDTANSANDNTAKIAIANPQLAPYGASAQTYLQQLGIYDKLVQQHRIIQAENISQTFQYVHSGSVDYGLVAQSQLIAASVKPSQYQTLATNSYPPILQDGITLNDKPTTNDFAHFLQTPQVQQQFKQAGYLPILQ